MTIREVLAVLGLFALALLALALATKGVGGFVV